MADDLYLQLCRQGSGEWILNYKGAVAKTTSAPHNFPGNNFVNVSHTKATIV
jgi:hypothetical protein